MDDGSSSSRAIPGPSTGPRTEPPSVCVIDEQPHPVDAERLRDLAGHALAACRVAASAELSLRLVDRDGIGRLNEAYLHGSGPTDVLAFPLDTPEDDPFGPEVAGQPTLLGDVVVCPAVAVEQAAGRDGDPAEEMEMLVVHGILHLLGHDHAEREERDRMFALTDQLLADFRRASPTDGSGR